MTRQREQAKWYVANGCCAVCGQLRGLYAMYCDHHAEYHRLRMRRRQGCKAKVPGKVGRPVKTAAKESA